MPYGDQHALALDAEFRKRIRIAMLHAAQQIQGEAPTAHADVDQKRASLAYLVAADGGNSKLDAFSFGVAAYNAGTISGQSSDSDLQFVVNTIWNDIAGVTGADNA